MYSKELLKGTISAIILKLLAEQPRMYGYEIFNRVKELSEGKILLNVTRGDFNFQFWFPAISVFQFV